MHYHVRSSLLRLRARLLGSRPYFHPPLPTTTCQQPRSHRSLATALAALCLAGYALLTTPANANHFGSGPDPSSAISNTDRSVQNQTGNQNYNPNYLQQQWRQSLPSWAKELMAHPEYMDRNGRLPGEPGYRGPRTADAIARGYGFEKRGGRWHYKGRPLPNQPGSSGLGWGNGPNALGSWNDNGEKCGGPCK